MCTKMVHRCRPMRAANSPMASLSVSDMLRKSVITNGGTASSAGWKNVISCKLFSRCSVATFGRQHIWPFRKINKEIGGLRGGCKVCRPGKATTMSYTTPASVLMDAILSVDTDCGGWADAKVMNATRFAASPATLRTMVIVWITLFELEDC